MTLDPTIPSDFIEQRPEAYEPRASRLVVPALAAVRTEVRTELWMGGVHTSTGSPVESLHVRSAWVVDCAGEMPPDLALAAGRHIPRVFADIETVPSNYPRVQALVTELAEALAGQGAPERVYVMCKQGLNRSGLVSALLLRALGTPSAEAMAAVRAARPGALNNLTFERLVHA